MKTRSRMRGLSTVVATCAIACGVGASRPSAPADGGAAAPEAAAPSPRSVSGLSDLIGVRGSAAESQMEARGYANAGGSAEGNAMVSYWRRESDGRCVAVTTSDGRYQAIAPAEPADCQRAEEATRVVTTEKTWFYVSNRDAAAMEVRSLTP